MENTTIIILLLIAILILTIISFALLKINDSLKTDLKNNELFTEFLQNQHSKLIRRLSDKNIEFNKLQSKFKTVSNLLTKTIENDRNRSKKK